MRSLVFAALLLASFGASANPLKSPSVFPISVWWIRPQLNNCGATGTKNCAQAAVDARISFLLGIGDGSIGWPENCSGTPADEGEIDAIEAAGISFIGSVGPNWSTNSANTPNTLACGAALLRAHRYSTTLWIGANAGDEPNCTGNAGWGPGPSVSQTPAAVARLKGYLAAAGVPQVVTQNMTSWERGQISWFSCGQPTSPFPTALRAAYAASFDDYVFTGSWSGQAGTDYNTVPADNFYLTSLDMQAMAHYAAPGQPLWAVAETGSDTLGSGQNNTMSASISGRTLTATGSQMLGSSWVGLTVTGLGVSGAKIASVTNSKHAMLSASGSGTGSVSIGGGVQGTDCVARVNLCVVTGSEYRATASQVARQVWSYLINGATGLGWFCQDRYSAEFCLGSAGADTSETAAAVLSNITWIDRQIESLAAILNGTTVAQCSMVGSDHSTRSSSRDRTCSSHGFTLKSADPAVPADLIVKSHDGALYAFVQPLARASSTGGTQLTVSYSGPLTGVTVTMDDNQSHDPTHALKTGTSVRISGGSWSEFFGANGDHYQVIGFRVI